MKKPLDGLISLRYQKHITLWLHCHDYRFFSLIYKTWIFASFCFVMQNMRFMKLVLVLEETLTVLLEKEVKKNSYLLLNRSYKLFVKLAIFASIFKHWKLSVAAVKYVINFLFRGRIDSNFHNSLFVCFL